MTDRQPTKPNRYAVYDDAHNFLRYEYHERADEPTQEGDALNKANLLPDTVATALGLTGNPQVKDALEKLSKAVSPEQYVWDRYILTPTFSLGAESEAEVTSYIDYNSRTTIEYGSEFQYLDGAYIITNKQTVSVTSTNYTSYSTLLRNKYWRNTAEPATVIRKGASNGTLRLETYTGDNWRLYFVAQSISYRVLDVYDKELVSFSPDTYPQNAEVEDYKYVYKGRPQYIDARIATGSYTGTGTYGSGNKNSLTLPFTPNLLIVSRPGNGYGHFPWICGETSGISSMSSGTYYWVTLTWNGSTIQWFSSDAAAYQLNENGITYKYFAIG